MRTCSPSSPNPTRWHSRRCFRSLLTIGLLAFIAIFPGCTRFGGTSLIDWWRNGWKVGPNYGRPAAVVADDWIEAENRHVKADQTEDIYWWTRLEDPDLDRLITLASEQNFELQSAGMRVLEARAIRAVTLGMLFPQSQVFSGQYLSTLQSTNQGLALPTASDFNLPRNWQNFDGMFGLGWEIDVWGRYRRALEASTADFQLAVEDYDAILVSLLAEVAINYVELRTFQQRLIYARSNVKAQEGSLRIATVRFEAGETDKLDVTQAESNLETTKALIPQLQIGVRQSENAICVLLGIPPQKLNELIPQKNAPIPLVPSDVALGTPADLIRRRPDLRSIERAAAAASARIGVVASSLYPSFAIDGTIGISARNFSSLWESSSIGGNFDPRFSWKIFNYGRIMNEIAAQDAIFQQRAIEYQQQILVANKEVEDALIAYIKSQEQVNFLLASTRSYEESVRLATLKYKSGETDFNQVFLLQADLTSVQDKLAQAQGSVATSLIGIYRALGSGWQIRLNSPDDAPQELMADVLPAPPVDTMMEDGFPSLPTDEDESDFDEAEPSPEVALTSPMHRILRNQFAPTDIACGSQEPTMASAGEMINIAFSREATKVDHAVQIRPMQPPKP